MMETLTIQYQRISFDFNIGDGTYTPTQLRKAGLIVQQGAEHTYTLVWPGGTPRPERADVVVKWKARGGGTKR
jgi:hypothetical protein